MSNFAKTEDGRVAILGMQALKRITKRRTKLVLADSMSVPVAANAPQPSAQVAARWLPPTPPDDASMTASATTVIEKSTLPLSRID
jgi:hypothetical protein